MRKHVLVLQIAQHGPKVQNRKKKELPVNNVRKLTAASESWHFFSTDTHWTL